jgi:hypothetical protein
LINSSYNKNYINKLSTIFIGMISASFAVDEARKFVAMSPDDVTSHRLTQKYRLVQNNRYRIQERIGSVRRTAPSAVAASFERAIRSC